MIQIRLKNGLKSAKKRLELSSAYSSSNRSGSARRAFLHPVHWTGSTWLILRTGLVLSHVDLVRWVVSYGQTRIDLVSSAAGRSSGQTHKDMVSSAFGRSSSQTLACMISSTTGRSSSQMHIFDFFCRWSVFCSNACRYDFFLPRS